MRQTFIFFYSEIHFTKRDINNKNREKGGCQEKIGKGARTGENISIKQVDRSVKGLEEKGIIKVGDTNRDGNIIYGSPTAVNSFGKREVIYLLKTRGRKLFYRPRKKGRKYLKETSGLVFIVAKK